MVVNMACPQCGGQASEYDANKWACLQCRNKFLYAPPPPPPATIINTSVNIQGSGLFDLDTAKACKPTPLFKKRSESDQTYKGQMRSITDAIDWHEKALAKNCSQQKVVAWICVFLLTLCFPLGWLGEVLKSDEITCLALISCPVVSCFLWIGCKRNKGTIEAKLTELRSQKLKHEEDDQSIFVGHRGSCPLCGATLFQIGVKENWPSGLQHCLQCGKQAFTVQGYTFPLKVR